MHGQWKRLALLVASLCLAGACGSSASHDVNGQGGDPDDPGSTTPPSSAVLTWHNDNYRTGVQLAEKVLTPAAVSGKGLHLRTRRLVDKGVNAQILYVPGLDVAGGTKNVV